MLQTSIKIEGPETWVPWETGSQSVVKAGLDVERAGCRLYLQAYSQGITSLISASEGAFLEKLKQTVSSDQRRDLVSYCPRNKGIQGKCTH
jgi:hypothetical protein